jgi:tetratricopeptide (TPR) repeat protein
VRWSDVVTKNSLANDAARGEANYYGAKAAFEQKEYDTALEKFRNVALSGQNEQAAESRYRIAQIYFLKGHPDAAEEQCHSANEKNANYPYWVAKSLILLSDIAAGRKDFFNAKAPLEAVIENFQGDDEITKEATEKLNKILALEQQQSRVAPDSTQSIQFINEDH